MHCLCDTVPQMPALRELNLDDNFLDDDCVEILVRGLARCENLHCVKLGGNRISDAGLELLGQRLTRSIDTLDLSENEVTLYRSFSILGSKRLILRHNAISLGGLRVIADSLVNECCRLEELDLS